MKYLIFTDMHMCFNSSIMPIHLEDSKYSTRLQMCMNTLSWIFRQAKKYNVDKILCGGDIFDSHYLRAEEITAISEVLSDYDYNIPMIIITGNHDILDSDSFFYSSSLFTNCDIYSKPTKIDEELSVLPYCNYEDITDEQLNELSNKILLSHIDLYGSEVSSNQTLELGLNPNRLNKFGIVFNGHIHKGSQVSDNVINIGSCTSLSFSDDNTYIPRILVYDSETNDIEFIDNPYSILFRTISVDNLEELNKYIKLCIKPNYKYILRVKTILSLQNEVSERLNSVDNIIAHRVVVNNVNNIVNNSMPKLDVVDMSNLKDSFIKFLSEEDVSLKDTLENYKTYLGEV